MANSNRKRSKSRKTEKENPGKTGKEQEDTVPVDEQAGQEQGADFSVDAGEETAEEVEARLKKEQKELMEKLLRLQADFENYRKRFAREKQTIEAHATEDLMMELIPVVDHFEMALNSAREHEIEQSVVQGFELVLSQLLSGIKKHGVSIIDAAEGEFDPNIHEAVAHVPSGEVQENGIVEQTRKGYKMGGKVIRAAEVIVSSGKPDESEKKE